jgi:hypothetical protein
MSYTESEMASSIIEQSAADGVEGIRVDTDLEVHYDHYGKRGAVDLITEDFDYHDGERYGKGSLTVYELKSESAVKSATGANEVIRQFKRHIKYFVEGSELVSSDYYDIHFKLVFEASKANYRHIRENEILYETVSEKRWSDIKSSSVSLYHPDVDGYWFPIGHDKVEFTSFEEREIKEIVGI